MNAISYKRTLDLDQCNWYIPVGGQPFLLIVIQWAVGSPHWENPLSSYWLIGRTLAFLLVDWFCLRRGCEDMKFWISKWRVCSLNVNSNKFISLASLFYYYLCELCYVAVALVTCVPYSVSSITLSAHAVVHNPERWHHRLRKRRCWLGRVQ